MIAVEIPIRDKKNPPGLKFPERCLNCGQPKNIVLPLKLNMGVEKHKQAVLMDLPVPLCVECEKKKRRITNVTLLPFTFGGLLVGAVAFVPAWLLSPQGTTPQTMNSDLVFGGFVALLAGIIGCTAVEFLLKLLFAPAHGKLLFKRPLTVLGFLNDSEEVIGFSARFTDQKKSLKLTFENDEIAHEFEGANL